MSTCFLLADNNSARNRATVKLKVKEVVRCRAVGKCKIKTKLRANITKTVPLKLKLSSTSKFKTFKLDTLALASKFKISSKINGKVSGTLNSSTFFLPIAGVNVKYTDKFNCKPEVTPKLRRFEPNQKLYPTADVDTELNGNFFVNERLGPTCYSSIDEGVSVENLGTVISDDKHTFIQPSSLYTDGTFRYICQVSRPTSTPKTTYLYIRASAPINNYGSSVPPTYKLYDILLRDSAGDTAVEYNDIFVRGDADYSDVQNRNFTTYVTDSKINNFLLGASNPNFPLLTTSSVVVTQSGDTVTTQSGDSITPTQQYNEYTLEFKLDIICEDKSFSEGFNSGYEDKSCNVNFIQDSDNDYLAIDGAPIGTQSKFYNINPSNHIRITALEIANSGSSFGFGLQDFVNLVIDTQTSGQRLSREILPAKIELSDYSNDIYPNITENLWSSSDSLSDNTTASGCKDLVDILRVRDSNKHITLDSTTVAESGKILLKFAHEPPKPFNRYVNGAFNIGFNSPDKEFDYAGYKRTTEVDSYFDIDNVFLKVIAKKAANTSGFYLDVVGYSDDRFLAVTPQEGGFLQNIDGVGSIPLVSGTSPTDEFGISSESISDKGDIFVRTNLINDGGDHHLVDQSAAAHVDSTEFTEYLVPLKIYEQSLNNTGHNFSISSYFEHLYLDICPIPTGASIAYIALVVSYKPSNALPLHTLGYGGVELGSENTRLFTAARHLDDNPNNTGPSYAPLSTINNIPQGYSFDDTLKTNYSRRWRNADGLVAIGPFDFNQFDFSFFNPQLSKPFFGGYFSFNDDVGNDIISEDMRDLITLQGSYVGNYDKVQNVGMRFTSSSLFNDPTNHTTIDWTSINGYQNDPLYGQIADAFDNAIRVSGDLGYISFPTFDLSDGCAIFVRFSPDVSMSGVDYNLYNSGVIFSKYDAGNDLEIALGYENGYLTAYATDDANNLITIQDSIPYSDYTYPLSAVVTYNNNGDSKLSLYTDNEKDSYGFNRLRAESNTFTITQGLSDLTFGYSRGEDVGFNGFITDIAISAPSTQIEYIPLAFNPSIFLDSIHTKYWAVDEVSSSEETVLVTQSGQTLTTQSGDTLVYEYASIRDTNKAWSYVDKDLNKWHLGSFNICEFDLSFDRFTSRYGKDYIVHRIKSDGAAYSSYADIAAPSGVDFDTSYHTQVENDMLRFYLDGKPESFASPNVLYGIRPRITNSFVRGYSIFEEAFVVDTVIDHVTYNDIVWDNGELGLKLIVSLYTKNKDNPETPYHNIGLINRSIHYLEPSGCIHKISSRFSFDDLFNEDSEGWSEFDQRLNKSELIDDKYLSKDVQDMFLQYDLIYPSGSAYDASTSIYGITVTLTEALHKARTIDNL